VYFALLPLVIDHLLAEMQSLGSVRFAVRVRPNAPRTRITAVLEDGSVKMDIAAPADGGKANAALLRGLADLFDVPLSHIELVSGITARQKVVKVQKRNP
jgi:hypothetical protein